MADLFDLRVRELTESWLDATGHTLRSHEYVSFSRRSVTLDCNFTKKDLEKIVKVMGILEKEFTEFPESAGRPGGET